MDNKTINRMKELYRGLVVFVGASAIFVGLYNWLASYVSYGITYGIAYILLFFFAPSTTFISVTYNIVSMMIFLWMISLIMFVTYHSFEMKPLDFFKRNN